MSTDFPDVSDSDWVSQAQAARLIGVSRQAIHKLVQAGRLQHIIIGGHALVSQREVEGYRPRSSGRPRLGEDRRYERIATLIRACDEGTKLRLLQDLRTQLPLHPVEMYLGASADVILEALHRSGELTVRMFRGVMAESAFQTYVVQHLQGWASVPVEGSQPYDFDLRDAVGKVRVQVKLQRSERGEPLTTGKRYRRFAPDMFVVETHRTRGSENKKGKTRPYRFGAFDILAICMRPSTGSWANFMYSVADWLLPAASDPTSMTTHQPLPRFPNDDWTDDFETCVKWLRAGVKKTIAGLRG